MFTAIISAVHGIYTAVAESGGGIFNTYITATTDEGKWYLFILLTTFTYCIIKSLIKGGYRH